MLVARELVTIDAIARRGAAVKDSELKESGYGVAWRPKSSLAVKILIPLSVLLMVMMGSALAPSGVEIAELFGIGGN